MRKVRIDYLQPGMKVARPVISSDGYVLLNTDIVLKKSYIEQLKFFNVSAIYIHDDLAPDLDVCDVISDNTRMEAIRSVKELVVNIRDNIFKEKKIIVRQEKIINTIKNIISDLLKNEDLVVNLTDIRTADSYTFAHSVNVCVLSILTGINLNFSENQLFHLGTGALLHDIGKTLIPNEIINKPGKLDEQEREKIKMHTIFDYNILENQSEISSFAAKVALQHHERIDGSGYPHGLKGKKIHLYSQITGIADVYDALTSDRVYRKAFLPHEAYEFLSGTGGTIYDYNLVKVFLSQIAPYPVGTFVKLNTGEIGVVVDVPKELTIRPVIRVFFKENRLVKEPYELKLTHLTQVVIKDIITEPELMQIKNGQKEKQIIY
ncbi:HD-GYP domain-containing protein [Bacillota bacterium LX-D]|nr:HD-GYP domain-containing protein [Bacillota bacterium LX-D]